jgi:16S rRNA (guanine527-N7)-methyltransferase
LSLPARTADLATAVFGDRVELARQYHDLLAGDGIAQGLLGPREVPRLWDRHLYNCAVITDLIPAGARVVDVGSGAGLPGLAMAIRRADLRIDLVESLQRRSDFLSAAVERLGLADAVRVIRGRAEEAGVLATVGDAEWVTARAVAPLDRLVRWCLPLLRPGGRLLAMKGSSAPAEMANHAAAMRAAGAGPVELVRCGADLLAEVTTVVVVNRGVRSPEQTRRTVR